MKIHLSAGFRIVYGKEEEKHLCVRTGLRNRHLSFYDFNRGIEANSNTFSVIKEINERDQERQPRSNEEKSHSKRILLQEQREKESERKGFVPSSRHRTEGWL